MLKIILVSAIRSLLKYKHISIINMCGLILGLTSFLFVQHYLLYEFSFDSFISQPNNVYRVNLTIDKNGENVYNGAKTPRALYFALKNSIPEIEDNGIAYFEKCLLNFGNISFANQDVLWVDQGFEKVMPIKMVDGVADYTRPRTGIISETCAKTFFASQNPIGQIMRVNEGMPIEITGVFADLPSNTHLTATFFASVKTWAEMGFLSPAGDWTGNNWWNYIRVKNNTSPQTVAQKINQLATPHMNFLNNNNRNFNFTLQPLTNLHFLSGIDGEMGAQTTRLSLYNLIAIVIIMMIIVWTNYINLSAAHNQVQAHQIKLRRLIGASRAHMFLQALTECFILTMAAIIISTILYLLLLKSFAIFFNIAITNARVPLLTMVLTAGVTIFTGMVFTSLYNGFSLSQIKILSAKKSNGGNFKSLLIVLQMTMSIIFIACTILVFKQIWFMKNNNNGIELNDVIVLTGPASLNSDNNKRARYQAFSDELLTNPGFVSTTYNMYVPGQQPRYGYNEFTNPANGATPDVLFFENNACHGLIDTYKMKLLAGTDFDINPEKNIDKIIITQNGIKLLGFNNANSAIGKKIYRRNNNNALEIIGVVSDYNNEGLQKPIYPIIWNNNYPWEFGFFAVRVNSRNAQASIKKLTQIWDKHYPNDNIDFTFANHQFNSQYRSEARFGKFFLYLTVLSIIIASMGLYGLILFTFEQRTKEIGVRKVNGATILQVMGLLNSDYVKLLTISFIIATPVAFYICQQWLSGFAYKTGVSWWIFVVSGVAALLAALTTVTYQSWRAATRNPVKALRYE